MDEGMSNSAEFRVAKKSTGTDSLKRFFIVLVWYMPAILFLVIGLASINFKWVIYLIPVAMVIAIPFSRHNYKRSFIEYEYALVSGTMRFDIVYGSDQRKEWFNAKISDMTLFAPYEGDYKAKADAVQAVNKYEAISSYESPDLYCGVYKNESGEQCVVIFEATNKLLKLASFYNRNAVVKKVRY
jgi:hypothetical protein